MLNYAVWCVDWSMTAKLRGSFRFEQHYYESLYEILKWPGLLSSP